MQIGIATAFGPQTTPEFVTEAGRAVEQCGMSSIWMPEHVVLFREYSSRYPYSDDGRLRVGARGGVLEPFLALTWLAAHTTTLRLGTGICLVPQRNPVYTAKQVADLDYLSGGRVDFGVGIGWLAEEFAALGVPWGRRAARTRDHLSVMKALWCEDLSSFSGEYYELPHCTMYPKPVQHPHPPIIFGGESEAALRRAADMGQGWYGFNLSPEELVAPLSTLDRLLAERDRRRADLKIHVSPDRKPCGRDELKRYRDAGVDQVIFTTGGRTLDDFRRRVEELAELA